MTNDNPSRPMVRHGRTDAESALAQGVAHDPAIIAGSAPRRIYAMVLRHWFLLRGSWPRLFELAYWPMVQMILWGVLSTFLATNSTWVAQAAGVLIAAVMLWDVLFRGQLGMSISFLEEMWARNLGHIFVSPIRPHEWVISLMAVSLIRTLIGALPAAIVAIVLYNFSIFSLGLPLLGFFLGLLVMGWWLALIIISLILRYGLGAESLAWMSVFLLAPLSAVYYPIEALPQSLHPLALALPSTHIFEGMRQVLFEGETPFHHLWTAMGLNLIYLAVAAGIFAAAFRDARNRGALLQVGE